MISPIHKSGDKNKPENYRGISLQSVLSKLFASILSKRLKTWCEIKNVIGEEQAGFRPSRSTIDNIFCLKTIVQKYLRKKRGECMLHLWILKKRLIGLIENYYGIN